ncbi:hypothetical protein F0U59_50695 [Archangium gephyra]|nr:hypothetical protein F0U59_50695 [Archangium gephyra]
MERKRGELILPPLLGEGTVVGLRGDKTKLSPDRRVAAGYGTYHYDVCPSLQGEARGPAPLT